jgi:hypothetical protein
MALTLGTSAWPAPATEATQAVQQAHAALRKDPNVSGAAAKRHVLTWASASDELPTVPYPAWLRAWLRWLGESGRVALWVAASVGAGVLVVYLLRLAQQRALDSRLPSLRIPTHVRDLDIRPESLPADIAAAALALWEAGERRAALALLYRGMLSRLVHVHATPIRASSTEEECARLAATRLEGPPIDYVRRLIRLWQDAVYGGAAPATEHFRGLCAELDTALPAATLPGGA